MQGRKVEIPHNSDEQVRDYIKKAAALVDELELDEPLQVPAFIKAVDLYAAKAITIEQVAPVLGVPGVPGLNH